MTVGAVMTVPFYTERDSYNNLPFGLIFGEFAPRRDAIYKEVKGAGEPLQMRRSRICFPFASKGKVFAASRRKPRARRPT